MHNRRRFLKLLGLAPAVFAAAARAQSGGAPDFAALKAGYARRLKDILAKGGLPYIDIESSCNPGRVDIRSLARSLDELQIGLMALSSDLGSNQFAKRVAFDGLQQRLLAEFPDRFIPVGNGGQPPWLSEDADTFLAAQEQAALAKQILLFGEYEFRHYPSPRQVQRGDAGRDVAIALDGPAGQRLFRMGEATGLPFQLHYEVEDRLLTVLEQMLERHPKARVIWCHVGQVRYAERASRYSAAYVDGLLRRFPNLHLDTAFGDHQSVYPVSGQRHARIWTASGELQPDWLELITAHPGRFLSALDLGQDRLHRIVEYDQKHRQFLSKLPEPVRAAVAYRNGWRLLFGEEFG